MSHSCPHCHKNDRGVQCPDCEGTGVVSYCEDCDEQIAGDEEIRCCACQETYDQEIYHISLTCDGASVVNFCDRFYLLKPLGLLMAS